MKIPSSINGNIRSSTVRMDKITLYSFVSCCLFFLLQRFFPFLKNRSFLFRVCFYDGVFLFKLSKIWIYQNVNILFSCRHYLNCSFQKISNLKTLATKYTPVHEVECSRNVIELCTSVNAHWPTFYHRAVIAQSLFAYVEVLITELMCIHIRWVGKCYFLSPGQGSHSLGNPCFRRFAFEGIRKFLREKTCTHPMSISWKKGD